MFEVQNKVNLETSTSKLGEISTFSSMPLDLQDTVDTGEGVPRLGSTTRHSSRI